MSALKIQDGQSPKALFVLLCLGRGIKQCFIDSVGFPDMASGGVQEKDGG